MTKVARKVARTREQLVTNDYQITLTMPFVIFVNIAFCFLCFLDSNNGLALIYTGILTTLMSYVSVHFLVKVKVKFFVLPCSSAYVASKNQALTKAFVGN